MRQCAGERTRCRLLKTRRQQLAARCCGVKPNECRDKSRAASKNARGLTVRADGKRTALYEFTWYDLNSDNVVDSGELKTNTYDWSYDDVGRLTDEALDHWDDTFDQTDSFTFDLTGNRTRLERDHGNDGVDQVITYDFDANDRLLNEILDDLVDNSKDTTTTYAYDHTQQTSKTVTAASQTVSKQVFGYNLQGRMSSVINEGYTSGTLSSRERTSYSYDSKSFRVEATTETGTATGTIANETWTLESSTSFLADAHNHTGYTQTIREVKTNADSTTETRDYTFGHDEIAQRVVTRDDQGQVTNDQTHIFGHDGHGSVRILYDLAVAVAPIVQAMTFSAYGELLALHNTAGVSLATTARLSSLGYSGEHFDANAQQQYLRARFYSPTTGRFNRLDPFAGNMQDPQSLHKYAYVHGDPVSGVDPSGEFFMGIAIGALLGFGLRGTHAKTTVAAGAAAGATIDFLFGITQAVWTARRDRYRNTATGAGGKNITPQLLTALADVKSQWDQRTKSEKENIFRDAHSFSGWDIDALQDSTYDSVLVPSSLGPNRVEQTVTVNGSVFFQAEVNYMLWGYVNALAHRDGIVVDTLLGRKDGSLFSAANSVSGYRSVTDPFWGFKPPFHGTSDGRVAWVIAGHWYATHGEFLPPTYMRLPNVTPTNSGITLHLGGHLGNSKLEPADRNALRF